MSGHSKWHNIQAKKGKTDAARGKIFTKIGRELAVHEHSEYKNISTITDFNTGYRFCDIRKEVNKVTKDDIKEALDAFIRHYTLEEIKERCKIKEEEIKG